MIPLLGHYHKGFRQNEQCPNGEKEDYKELESEYGVFSVLKHSVILLKMAVG
jgi:hypothetical protein